MTASELFEILDEDHNKQLSVIEFLKVTKIKEFDAKPEGEDYLVKAVRPYEHDSGGQR